MKTPEQILQMAKKVHDKAKDEYDKAAVKLGNALAKGGYAYWAEWNLLDLVWVEQMKQRWAGVVGGINQLVLEGNTSEEILEYIKGYREGVIRDVMNARTPSSTSVIGNAIDSLGQDVAKEFAGSSLIGSDSLAELIYNAGGKL